MIRTEVIVGCDECKRTCRALEERWPDRPTQLVLDRGWTFVDTGRLPFVFCSEDCRKVWDGRRRLDELKTAHDLGLDDLLQDAYAAGHTISVDTTGNNTSPLITPGTLVAADALGNIVPATDPAQAIGVAVDAQTVQLHGSGMPSGMPTMLDHPISDDEYEVVFRGEDDAG